MMYFPPNIGEFVPGLHSLMPTNYQPTYAIEAIGGNRFNVVRRKPTVVAKELRWGEAVTLADELNEEAANEERS